MSSLASVNEDDVSSETDFPSSPPSNLDSDTEMPYESAPRNQHRSWDLQKDHAVQSLPIKLANGHIQKTGSKNMVLPSVDVENDGESEESERLEINERERVEDISTGARFGRTAVVDIIGNKDRKTRLQGAKDQIAGICQEIVAEPENSVSES